MNGYYLRYYYPENNLIYAYGEVIKKENIGGVTTMYQFKIINGFGHENLSTPGRTVYAEEQWFFKTKYKIIEKVFNYGI